MFFLEAIILPPFVIGLCYLREVLLLVITPEPILPLVYKAVYIVVYNSVLWSWEDAKMFFCKSNTEILSVVLRIYDPSISVLDICYVIVGFLEFLKNEFFVYVFDIKSLSLGFIFIDWSINSFEYACIVWNSYDEFIFYF